MFRVILVLGALAVTCVTHASDVLYHATRIGDLPGGGSSTWCEDINDLGKVTGDSSSEDYNLEAYVWEASGSITSLGDFPGSRHGSVGFGINYLGHVAGVGNSVNGVEGFLWTAESGLIPVGDLPGGVFYSATTALNDKDEVVGYSSGNGDHQLAFIWSRGEGMISLGSFGSIYNSVAYAINNSSQVTGWSGSVRFTEAFIWDKVSGMRGLGTMPDGSFATIGTDINERGQIVGSAATLTGEQPFIWNDRDGIRLLGVLPGPDPSAGAYGLNDIGQVVGMALLDDYTPVAFLWDEQHGMRNLRDLLDGASRGWRPRLRYAVEINNGGQIAVYAGGGVSLLLEPFVLGDLDCDGSVNAFDIEPFVLALQAATGDGGAHDEYKSRYPGCHGEWAADANQDGSINQFDIQAFVDLIAG